MNCYVQSGIKILNNTTKELENLNELGIYLSKQTDIDALKSLKLLILASENSILNKDFDIDSTKTYTESFGDNTYKKNETITGNLSRNPQNIGLELMEFILHNYDVNLKIEQFNSGYTIFDFWTRSFSRIEDDQDIFYRRYDMIDRKLNIVSYMIKNGLLNAYQVDFLLTSFDHCIQKKYGYSNEQLLKMQDIIDDIKLTQHLSQNVSNLINTRQFKIDCPKDEFLRLLLSSIEEEAPIADRKKYFREQLLNYEMQNDQCCYMIKTIPKLVKEKIIK